MSLDVLLIHPNAAKRIYQELSNTLNGIEQPIWAGMIATYLRDRNVKVDILDCEANGLTVDEAYEKYGEPMYCGFASVTIRPARGRFVKFIQKLGLGHRGVYGGYSLTYHDIMKEHKLAYTQSMDLKEIGCHAFAKTLGKYGIEAVMESRPD